MLSSGPMTVIRSGVTPIALRSPGSSPVTHSPISLAETASLAYQAMSNSDDIVLVLERDEHAVAADVVIIAANEAFHRASGYSDDNLLGRSVAELFPSGNDAELLTNAIRGPGSLRSELACSRQQGDNFILGLHLMPAPERVAGKACFVILGRDITASVQARQMQGSIQLLLAKVFSSVDIAVAIVNGAGRIVMTNRHLDRLLGVKPNGLVGAIVARVVAPGSLATAQAIIRQQMEDGCDATYSVTALRQDGRRWRYRLPRWSR